jgi:pimeloyl-ACP methyl ester carboxylesterase
MNRYYEPMDLFKDEELRRLNMPTMLVGGRRDSVQDMPGLARRMKQLLPNLTVMIYPDRGHVLSSLAGDIIPFLMSDET